MSLSSYIPLISAIFNLSIGIYLLSRNPKNKINIIFFMFVLNITLYNVSEFLTRMSVTAEEALLWGRLCYTLVALGPVIILHFTLIYPRKIIPKRYDSLYKYGISFFYVLGLIVYIFFIYSTSIQNVEYSEWGYRLPVSISQFFILIWFVIMNVLIISYLIYKYFRGGHSSIEKKQIILILTGGLLMVIAAVGTNILPPLLDVNIFPMTSVFTSIFVIFVSYSILKYKFLSLSSSMIAENILNTIKNALIVVDKDENIVNVNKYTLDILNYKKRELINSSLNRIVQLPGQQDKINNKVFLSPAFQNIIADTKSDEDIEIDFVNKSGRLIPMSTSASALYEHNNIEGFVLVARDLSDIKKSLKEKEVLLKEIHHRVKNNLQLISSLLDLQSQQTKNKDKDTIEVFRDCQNRIKLIANLHEQLYQSKNLAKIDFKEYIQNLITNLFFSYKKNPDDITLTINIKDIFMDVDTSLLCSLIINELISNSLKHAFPKGKKGEIIIDLIQDHGTYNLTVTDTGIGFPNNIDFKNTKTLGLQLVNIFVKQLKGSISLEKIGMTKFIITF